MPVFTHIDFDHHEQVVFGHDQASGLKAIIAVHDTTLGPALGGCRMWNYASDEEALRDSMADWLATPEGRLYVATFVVHGPNGTVTVGGKSYTGMMPMYRWRMKDPEMIAVLRYVAETLNKPKPGYVPFDTAVVTQARAIPDDEALIHGMRAKLPPR